MSQDHSNSTFIDFYEFLMVSSDADKPMIEWAVRLLATRFGKKNGEYVDEAKYNLVRQAFRTLSDPSKRAAYDAARLERLGQQKEDGDEDASQNSEGSEPEASASAPAEDLADGVRRTAEQIKVPAVATAEDKAAQQKLRQGIVAALYDILVVRPRNPELGRAEIARQTGVVNDELEFAVWYLRETEILRTTPAGLYTLTAKGVEWAESGGVAHLKPGVSAPPIPSQTVQKTPAKTESAPAPKTTQKAPAGRPARAPKQVA